MSNREMSADELSKLTATWCNTISAACIVVGVLTPISQLAEPTFAARAGWGMVASSLAYLVAGLVMHIAGRIIIELRFKP